MNKKFSKQYERKQGISKKQNTDLCRDSFEWHNTANGMK